jgi:hypothetical protein
MSRCRGWGSGGAAAYLEYGSVGPPPAAPSIPQAAFRIAQWWAPPCIWIFLSSLRKSGFFSNLLVS